MDKVWVFLICFLAGVGIMFAAWLYEKSLVDEARPAPGFPVAAGPQEDPAGETVVVVLRWAGGAVALVGVVGLIFCGVHRSSLIGRPGY